MEGNHSNRIYLSYPPTQVSPTQIRKQIAQEITPRTESRDSAIASFSSSSQDGFRLPIKALLTVVE